MFKLILCVAAALFILWLLRWKIHEDTIVCYTGGVGAGKSFMSAANVRRAYKQQLKIWKNMRHLPGFEEPPLIYSSIPYQYSPGKFATRLVEEHLLLQFRCLPCVL